MTDTTRTLTPIGRDETVADQEWIHVQIAPGVTIEGPAAVSSLDRPGHFRLGPIRLHTFAVECFRVVGERRPATPTRRTVTVDEVKDAFDRLSVSDDDGRAVVVAIADLYAALLGADLRKLVIHTDQRLESVYSQFVVLANVKDALAELERAGHIVAVRAPAQFDRSPERDWFAWLTTARTGWVLATARDEAAAHAAERADASRVAELRAEAARIVAERHADEVEAELARLLNS